MMSIVFSGCSKQNSNTIEDAIISSVAPSFEQTSTSENVSAADSPEPTKQTVSRDYTVFAGEWICEDKKTSLDIKIEPNGSVSGSITTVVGSQVPSSLISGIIQDNILISKLYDGDNYSVENYIGILVLSLTEPQIIKGNVKLEKSVINLAEGDMLFIRYCS